MSIHGGDDRDHELGHGGAHGDHREANDAVGKANTCGDLTRPVYEKVGAPDEQGESNDDEE